MRLQFSLRTMLVVFVAMALVLSFARRARQQRKAVRELDGAGLVVVYDVDDSDLRVPLRELRKRLASLIGKDWVASPVEVRQQTGCVIDQGVVRAIRALTTVESVDLRGTEIDDDSIPLLAHMWRLSRLNLDYTDVTDRGLSPLADVRSLRHLSVDHSFVTLAAAKDFRVAHAACEVICNEPARRDNPFLSRSWDLWPSADRLPTKRETEELAAAIQILNSSDNQEKWRFRFILFPPEKDALTVADPEWLEAQRDDWLWDAALEKIGNLGLSQGIPTVARVARDKSYTESLRANGMRALSTIRDPQIIPVLIELLEDESERISRLAEKFLIHVTGAEDKIVAPTPRPWSSNTRRVRGQQWRIFWEENRDVIRLRRPPGFV